MTGVYGRLLRRAGMAALVAAALTLSVRDASAAFKMTIDNLATGPIDLAFADGDIDGLISFSGAAGSFTTNTGAAFSKGVNGLGSVANPRMDLLSFNRSTGSGSKTVVIKVTDTGFMSGVGKAFMSIGGTTDGTVTYSAYWDSSNAEFGTASQIGSTLSFGPGGINFPFSGSNLVAHVGSLTPYSLTQIITITHDSGTRASSLNAALTVPEPASIALLGLGLAGLAVVARRRVAARQQ